MALICRRRLCLTAEFISPCAAMFDKANYAHVESSSSEPNRMFFLLSIFVSSPQCQDPLSQATFMSSSWPSSLRLFSFLADELAAFFSETPFVAIITNCNNRRIICRLRRCDCASVCTLSSPTYLGPSIEFVIVIHMQLIIAAFCPVL